MTGASFFVFSGALKSSSGYLAKSSIVEGKNWAACCKPAASPLPLLSSVVIRALMLCLGYWNHAAASALSYFLAQKTASFNEGNLPRCSRTGTQENEGKIWNTWLVIVVSVYCLGLNEEIVSLRNTECVMHRPGEEAPLTLLCSQIALHYVRLWMCIYRLLRDAMRTRKVRITVVVPLGFVHPSVTTCDMTERSHDHTPDWKLSVL